MWGKVGVVVLALLAVPALPSAGAGVAGALVGTATLNAWTHEGCLINDSGALAVAFVQERATFHFRGLVNDVHGTSRMAVWDAATLLPLGFFCREGEILELVGVREFEVSCPAGSFHLRAQNDFFRVLEISGGGECA